MAFDTSDQAVDLFIFGLAHYQNTDALISRHDPLTVTTSYTNHPYTPTARALGWLPDFYMYYLIYHTQKHHVSILFPCRNNNNNNNKNKTALAWTFALAHTLAHANGKSKVLGFWSSHDTDPHVIKKHGIRRIVRVWGACVTGTLAFFSISRKNSINTFL